MARAAAAVSLALTALVTAAPAAAAAVALPVVASDACSSCTAQVGALAGIANNATAVAAWVAGLQANCTAEYPGSANATQRELCDAVASAAGGALPWLYQQLGTLAYDPLGVCSVFVPVCRQPCCADAVAPEQVHLSLTGDLTEMAVAWTTLNATAATTVQWAPAPCGAPPFAASAAGFTRTYTQGGWVGVVHVATMTGLQRGGTYCYRVGDGSTTDGRAWSPVFNFTAMPADVGTPGSPLRFLSTGDMGYGPNSDATVAALLAEAAAGPVHFLLQDGDTSYDDGYAAHNDMYMRKIEPLAAYVPVLTVRGNHEATWWNATAYSTRFYMPNDAVTHGFYYSLNAGPLHLVMFDTESPLDTPDVDATQRAWLSADLAGVDRAATPLVVAAGHRPLYCTDKSASVQCGDFAALLRGLVEDAFLGAGVDVVVGAHEHGYERTYRVAHGNVTDKTYLGPGAPAYVINGAAGNREGNQMASGNQPWSAAQSAAVGYSLVTITAPPPGMPGNATLVWRHLASADRSLIDEWTLTKAV